MWQALGHLFGYEAEETEEQKITRERRHERLSVSSESEREDLLSELVSAISDLEAFILRNQQLNNSGPSPDLDTTTTTALRMSSTEESKSLVLNDDLPEVTRVCDAIDRCWTHGLRKIGEGSDDSVKMFGVLKWTCARVEARTRDQDSKLELYDPRTSNYTKPERSRAVRGFTTAVRAAASLTSVVSEEGKARAFCRQALNLHLLHPCLSAVLNLDVNLDLLMSYYTEYAFFRSVASIAVFLSTIETLDRHRYGFRIDDRRLDHALESRPFLTPLPVPQPQEGLVKKAPPKLINAEDMFDGRIRLSGFEDPESSQLLANKLIRQSQLDEGYNDETQGGNPLVRELRKTQLRQMVDDATTAVLRFFEVGYPEYEVFGTSLDTVMENPFLSGMARFDPTMGLPDVMEVCICFLHRNLATPGLFQVHLASEQVMDIRDAIEEVGGLHKGMIMDPHEVVAILFQYLWELPEPLFTDEMQHAFVACGQVRRSSDQPSQQQPQQHLRSVKVLIDDLPASHKPLLERLLHLFSRALLPEFSQVNGLDIKKLALQLAPLTLRHAREFQWSDLDDASTRRYPVTGHMPIRNRFPLNFYEPGMEQQQVANEAAEFRQRTLRAKEKSHVVEILIQEQASLLTDIRAELEVKGLKLREKVERMESLRTRLATPIDLTDDTHVRLLKRLWDGLLVNDIDDDKENVLSLEDNNIQVKALLSSARWCRSGFHTVDPLGGFRGGGLLSLEIMAYFVHEYPAKAQDMMIRNAEPGGNRYPFPVACISVLRMMMKLAMVDEAPEHLSRLVLHTEARTVPRDNVLEMKVAERVSRTTFWKIFDDPKAFEQLHGMAFMILDLHWTRSGATQMGFNPVLDSTRRQMGWLLEQKPTSIEDMWKMWMQVREEQQMSRHADAYLAPSSLKSTEETRMTNQEPVSPEADTMPVVSEPEIQPKSPHKSPLMNHSEIKLTEWTEASPIV